MPKLSMRVIPVLDIRRGEAVRAVAGDRAHYGPLQSVLHDGTDPVALARASRDRWGFPALYLADLDAILGEARPNVELYRQLADLGLTLWIDAGIRQASDVAPLVEAGVDRVIVGLETIEGPDALAEIVAKFGPDRVVFSLDLHDGKPMIDTRTAWGSDQPEEIASNVLDLGVTRIIHLDLSRVGTGQGIHRLGWQLDPRGEWYVGGGIQSIADLQELSGTEYTGVLIGSSLHDGRITVS